MTTLSLHAKCIGYSTDLQKKKAAFDFFPLKICRDERMFDLRNTCIIGNKATPCSIREDKFYRNSNTI